MKRLENKVAVITGGNSGIGLATAREFLNEGAQVVLTGRDKSTLDQAASELGSQALTVVSDAGKLDDIQRLATLVKEKFGRVDVLFLNAGIAKFAPIEMIDEATYQDTFDINVKGVFFTVKALLPLMKEGSSVIINASINANIGMANSSIYAASKAAALSFARTLSGELVSRKIRVNAISPGPVNTPIYGRLGLSPEQLEQMAGSIQGQVPLGRFGTPEEIAKVALFFASDDSSFILGAELVVDGGMSTI